MCIMNRDIYVDEDLKLAIQVAIDRFIKDESSVECEFPSSFTSAERAYIHRQCNQIGLISKSRGKGTNRCMTIRKKQPHEIVESPMMFQFGQNSHRVLHSLLHRWPLKQKEKQDIQPKLERQIQVGYSGYRSDSNKPSGRLPNGIPQIPMARSPSTLDEFRTKLAVYDMKDMITKTIRDNSIVLISGDTGTGKTTQIPQFILDESLKRNEVCRIVCTQPRRISAVANAERVAIERGESVGQTVGYQIRLESRASPRTLLTFCTNGVLLRTLMAGDNALQSITHIIVDEVHERDRFSDFLLIKLRKLISSRKPHFRLILMSASVDIDLFLDYFAPCPLVKIKGNSFKVEQLFLEDVLHSTAYFTKDLKKLRKEKDHRDQQEQRFKKWCADSKKNELKEMASKDDTDLDVEVEKITMEEHRRPVSLMRQDDLDKAMYDAWHEDGGNPFDRILSFIIDGNAPVDHRHAETGITALMTCAAHGMLTHVEQLVTLGADPGAAAPGGLTAVDMALKAKHTEIAAMLSVINEINESPRSNFVDGDNELLSLYNQSFANNPVDYDLVLALLHMICSCSDEGAILIFLPGYDDIVTLRGLISDDADITKSSDVKLFTMHTAMQSPCEQKQAFQPVAEGTRKIVLATNIAESAITINDIIYVIDTGKTTTKIFDAATSTTLVKSNWISKANAKQRMGRAGRCSPGVCYHLFSRTQYEEMVEHPIPEFACTPLHELCLQTKLLDEPTSVSHFFLQAPSPPPGSVTDNAVSLLKAMDALDSFENLTELGQHLVDLPIEPRLGKMILYSVVLKCLDPILTIACSLSFKDPFIVPRDHQKRAQAMESKRKFSAGTFSDHMSLLRAFQAWQKARSDGWERNFCQRNFMSQAVMEMIVAMRSQLLGQLRATGFVRARGGSDIRDLNTNSENWAVVKAALCASMFPNLLRVDRKHQRLSSSTCKNAHFFHSSVLSQPPYGKKKHSSTILQSLPSDWLIYDEMIQSGSQPTSLAMAMCCTSVSSTCVALFGGQMYLAENDAVTDPENSSALQGYSMDSDSESDELDIRQMATFTVTDWIKINMEPTLAHMLAQLRTKWYSLFARRIRNQSKPWQQEDEAILSTIINILSSEDQTIGLTQPSGIGQRPRPITHDDGSRSSHFMPRTPSSGKSDHPSIPAAGKRQPKSLNFRNILATSDRSSGTDGFHGYGGLKAQGESTEKSSNLKPVRYFTLTMSSLFDFQQSQSSGSLTLTKDAADLFNKAGKDTDLYLFFALEGSCQLQGFAKLNAASDVTSNILPVKWLKDTPLSNSLTQLAYSMWNSRVIFPNLQELDPGLGETLIQLWNLPQPDLNTPS